MATIKESSFNVRPDKHTSAQINLLNPEMGAIVFDTDNNVNRYWNGVEWAYDVALDRVVVNQDNAELILGGTIDSTKQYFIDGTIDIGSTSIEVPSGGIFLAGYNLDLSKIISSEDNYTMFTSPVGGSGNVFMQDISLTASGSNSKIYDITDANGFNAVELIRVNYNGCTSLGEINNYRQGLENGTGRFGGSPSLTLSGTWIGGYRITTSIVRGMDDTTAQPLFKAGAGFTMNSRFLTDINCDLGTLQPFCDFSPSNFPNPSTIQVRGAIFTRDFQSDATDSNIFTNLTEADLACDWSSNNGLTNTFEGGRLTLTSEVSTTLSVGVWSDLLGDFTADELQHFDEPSNGQLRHLGNNPREFRVIVNFSIEGGANDEIGLRYRKWDNSAGVFVDGNEVGRQINSFVGGRDVAFYTFITNIELDQNDYIYWQIRNNTDNTNVTLELNSDFIIEQR